MKKLKFIILGTLFLTSCENSSWFGEDKKVIAEGTRISVLDLDRSLKVEKSDEDTQIILPKPEPTPRWPQAGGYSHHNMQHLILRDNPQEIWNESIGEGNSGGNLLIAEPIVANGKVFTVDAEGKIAAFSLADGDLLWKKEIKSADKSTALKGAGLAYENGVLFVTMGIGEVYALETKKGGLIWRINLNSPIRSAPTVYAGRLYVLTIDNRIIALSTYTGESLWSYNAVAENTVLLGTPAPAADKGVVIAAFSSGEIYALKSDNGLPLWSGALVASRHGNFVSGLSAIKARVVIDDNIVYAIGNGNIFTATNLLSGERIWEKDIGAVNQPWIGGKYIFVITNDAELIAMDKNTAEIIWITKLPLWEEPEDKSGKIIWSGPILASNKLIVVGSNAKLLAFSPYSGEKISETEMNAGVTIAPVIAEGVLLVVDEEGELTAYK